MVVAADLMRRGFEVFRAAYGASSCDLVTSKEKVFERVEVKLGRWNGRQHAISLAPDGRDRFDRLAVVGVDGSVRYRPPLD